MKDKWPMKNEVLQRKLIFVTSYHHILFFFRKFLINNDWLFKTSVGITRNDRINVIGILISWIEIYQRMDQVLFTTLSIFR
jgi:hypothetical protein